MADLEKTEKILKSVNKIEHRLIAILVNPVSGKGRARGYYNNILKPILNTANLEYRMFETTSGTYVDDWINGYSYSNFPFTDIICVGGDGLFSQLINAFGNHNDRSDLFKIPIGLLPCGSQNAIACDLGGRNVFNS
jgi:sphingosine kinase